MSKKDGESTVETAGGRDAEALPRISVVVPTYNRAEGLRLTLESLCLQTLPADEFEVIVADDGSSDETRSVVDSFAGRLHLKYHFQEDLGYRAAAVRNAGARLAAAPLLAFLDCATVAGPDTLSAFLRAHIPGWAIAGYVHAYPLRRVDDPDYVAIPGLAEAVRTMTPQEVVSRYRDEPSFRDARHAEFEKVGFDLRNRIVPEEMFWTSACSIPATDFWAVGGFDEGFYGWGLEDLDLSFRLVRNGTAIQLCMDAWAIETPHPRDGAANVKGHERNILYFFDKYRFADPLFELGWLMHFGDFTPTDPMILSDTGGLAALEILSRRIADWTRQCADVTVAAELEQAFKQIAPDARVAVFGAGTVIPAVEQSCVLADFDRAVVDRLFEENSGAQRDVRHNVGIRTALPDKAVDTVVITSRLSGLWDMFGPAILAEAHRIGAHVRHPAA